MVVIESIIPQGANEWNTVALKYKELSHEVNPRAGDQMKSISTKIFARMAKKKKKVFLNTNIIWITN